MRLGSFISSHLEDILQEWEVFAISLGFAKGGLSKIELRNHAKELLAAVVADMKSEQSPEWRTQKSKGIHDSGLDAPHTAAQTHAFLRAENGMDIIELASEYRALRASVLRLWGKSFFPDGDALLDVIRFNEALDQALAESIAFFAAHSDRSRNLLMGMLGHDMRNPLNAIIMTAERITCLREEQELWEAAQCIVDSGSAMEALLNDLVDFSRRKLGLGIHVEARPMNLGKLCENEVRQHRVTNPEFKVELKVEGDLQGTWDEHRIRQVLRNLLSNATAYGRKEDPVRVVVTGDNLEVHIAVRNTGAPISVETKQHLFEPLARGKRTQLNKKGLGLGLYIVREIARAHGGDVEVFSGSGEIVFSVRLPKAPQEPPPVNNQNHGW